MTVQGPDGKRIQFPDGTPPDTIRAVMAKRYGGPQGGWNQAGAELTQRSPYPEWLSSAQDLGARALPFVGGVAGGIAGTAIGMVPGGIQGAAIGGTLGEAGRRALTGQPMSPLPVLHEGASQALQQAAGVPIGAAAGYVGRKVAVPIMRRALGVGRSFKSFVGPAETAVAEGLTKSGKGLAKATSLREQSVLKLMDTLRSAERAGHRISTRAILRDATAYLKNPAIPEELKLSLAGELDKYMARFGGSVDPVVAKGIKQYWQGVARTGYDTGRGQLADVPKTFYKKVASGAQASLEGIPGYGPRIGAQEARTQSIMGAERAIKAALARPAGSDLTTMLKPLAYPVIGGALGGAAGGYAGGHQGAVEGVLGGALVGGGLRSSRVAVMLGSSWFRRLAEQSPRAAAALVRELSAAPADATQP